MEFAANPEHEALVRELWDPERLCAAGIGPDPERFQAGLAPFAQAVVESAG